ncbi:MAG: hypothetical protein SVJ22_11605 [Halobacteriota archaeon]|nr:hypothetical protein [Halobacteriota archaeon]
MNSEKCDLKKEMNPLKQIKEIFKILCFSYLFIGTFNVVFTHAYALLRGYDPTFRIWMAFILGAPFWIWAPNVRIAGTVAMIVLSFTLIKFKALKYRKFEILATAFQILLFILIAVYFGIYLYTWLRFS